jgi:site-specific DNA recombinase
MGKIEVARQVGIYCRISDDRDGKAEGVERQELACREFAKTKGWPVVRTYTDNDISATKNKKARPAYKNLMSDLASGEINTLVVWAIDRLYRRPIELEDLLDLLKFHPDISVAAVSGGTDLRLETSDGQVIARILVALAKRETDMLTARILAKHEELARAGKPHGGARTFGYNAGQMTVNEEEAAIVRKMLKLFLATQSSSQVVKWLNAEGIKTARGGNHWSRKTVSDILRNPRTAGYRSHHGTLTKAVWPAIVEEDDWQQARAILSDPSRRTTDSHVSKYLLTGLVFCGNCGHRMTNMTRGKKLASTNTYACRKDEALVLSGCGSCRMFGAWVDEFVTEAVLHRLKNDKSLIKGLAAKKNTKSDSEQKALLMQLSKNGLFMNEAQDYWLKGEYTKGEYERAHKILGETRRVIEQQLNRLEAVRPVTSLLASVDLNMSWEERTLLEKRALLRLLIEKVMISKSLSPGRNTFDSRRIEILWRKEL